MMKILLLIIAAIFLSGCVLTTRRNYHEQMVTVAVLSYTAGLNDCGASPAQTRENILKRIDTVLGK